jgi:hypothetical protein
VGPLSRVPPLKKKLELLPAKVWGGTALPAASN